MVAPYDAKTEEQIFTDARLVDQFYAELLDTAEEKRQYAVSAPNTGK